MAVATASTIKTQILAGSYPDNTISSDNTFDFEQYERRRKYPSCEIITIQPESTTETTRSTETTVAFEIRYYVRNLGGRSDEVSTQKSVEDEILSQMEAMTIQDHRVVFESKQWNRTQVQRTRGHPAYIVSTLRITIRQITQSSIDAEGTMTFINASSNVDNAPGSDYIYSSVFDVDIMSGYRDHSESYTSSNIPKHFAGDLEGRAMFNVIVNAADLGSTGDKLNQMNLLKSNGERPEFRMQYVDKTNDDSTITQTFDMEVDSVQFLYRTNDSAVFRVIGTLISDVTTTVT